MTFFYLKRDGISQWCMLAVLAVRKKREKNIYPSVRMTESTEGAVAVETLRVQVCLL